MKTLVYKSSNNCDIRGDFYPSGKSQAPLIVYIHGGGLVWGTRNDMNTEQIGIYQKAGFNVFSIDYRLAPETKLPEIISDIEDALIWLTEEGKDQADFDSEKIAVIGSSAGAYLALLSGSFNVRPKAIVSFYGYGDITGDWYTKPSPHFTKMTAVPEMLAKQLIQDEPISGSPIEKRYAIYLYCRQQGKWLDYVTGLDPSVVMEKLHAYCPVKHVDATYPATLLLHGNKDEDVPYTESVKMGDALDKAGVENRLITIENGAHTFDQDMKDPQVVQAFDEVMAFLHEHL